MLCKVRGLLTTHLPLHCWAFSLYFQGALECGQWSPEQGGEMPGPWALAWLREQAGQGLAWGSATLHKGLRRLAGCQEMGGWLGTTPG